MVVSTCFVRIIILAFHLHLLSAHMTGSEDKNWLPKISQPEFVWQPCFLCSFFHFGASLTSFKLDFITVMFPVQSK